MITATSVPAPRPAVTADRWDDITGLTRDSRARVADRLALRMGLWLVLHAERRLRRLAERGERVRQSAVREATAQEQYESRRQHAYLMMLYHG